MDSRAAHVIGHESAPLPMRGRDLGARLGKFGVVLAIALLNTAAWMLAVLLVGRLFGFETSSHFLMALGVAILGISVAGLSVGMLERR